MEILIVKFPSMLWHGSASCVQPLHLLFLTSLEWTTSQIIVPEQEINHHVITSLLTAAKNCWAPQSHSALWQDSKVSPPGPTHQTGSLALPTSWFITGVVACHDVATSSILLSQRGHSVCPSFPLEIPLVCDPFIYPFTSGSEGSHKSAGIINAICSLLRYLWGG